MFQGEDESNLELGGEEGGMGRDLSHCTETDFCIQSPIFTRETISHRQLHASARVAEGRHRHTARRLVARQNSPFQAETKSTRNTKQNTGKVPSCDVAQKQNAQLETFSKTNFFTNVGITSST